VFHDASGLAHRTLGFDADARTAKSFNALHAELFGLRSKFGNDELVRDQLDGAWSKWCTTASEPGYKMASWPLSPHRTT
jgi:hypothetical protein